MLCLPAQWVALAGSALANSAGQEPEPAAKSFELCLDDIGNYVFGFQSSEAFPIETCPSNDLATHLDIDRWRLELLGAQQRNEKFDLEHRQICLETWRKDWAKAIERATGAMPTSKTMERIPVNMTALESEVFYRSRIEQVMTLLAEERMTDYVHDNRSCYNIWLNISAARQENVAFFIHNSILDRLLSGEMSAAVHQRIWLVVQHADLFPNFQRRGLETFRTATKNNGFPEELASALEARIQSNMQEQWYRDLAEKYKFN